jgi:glycosyltransferase involved in cell wall biosynthesis
MNNKLRILHVCSSRSWGGAEIAAVKLAEQFSLRGHDIIFAAHPKGRIITKLQNTNIEVIPVSFFRYFDPFTVSKLINLIKKHDIDIVHCHLSRDLAHLYWVTFFVQPLPVILDKQVSSSVSKKNFIHRLIYSKVSKIFVLSTYLERNVLETCPVTEDKVVVIPVGVRLEDYKIPDGVRERIRNEWKLDDDVFVFGTVSRIDRQKGLEELVRAFGSIVRTNHSVKLVIVGEPTVGEPEFAKKLSAIIKELGLENKVLFVGFRSDIPHVLSAFDVFVLPSYAESFGYVYIEALASKLPVIATNAGGVPDIIEDNVCGILVQPKDQKSLYEAMELLSVENGLRKQFGSAGRVRVEEKFLESQAYARIEREYFKLLGKDI